MMSHYLIGLSESEIPTPALIIDAEILELNIRRMMDELSGSSTKLRPHTKSHKSPMIGHLQMRAGAIGLCCATVAEAEAMVYAGLDHILIANEVIGAEKIRRVINLSRNTDVMVVADAKRNLHELSSAAVSGGVTLGVLVDLDVGMGRCGVRTTDAAVDLAKSIRDMRGIQFRGVMGYEGHAVFIPDRTEREKAARTSHGFLLETVRAIEKAGIEVPIVTGGGTGTYDITTKSGLGEIEAGSYIFMDTTYQKVGLPFSQSLFVLSSVLSRPDDETVILDTGIKAISVERSCPVVDGVPSLEILKLSEEHAKGRLSGGNVDPNPGDKLRLIPSHCCSTVNLHRQYFVLRHGKIEAVWPIMASGDY